MNKPHPPHSKKPLVQGITYAFSAAASAATDKDLPSGWVRLFYAGEHQDKTGKIQKWTIADLDQMVANHARWAAPAVIGHQPNDGPRYATIKDLKREGENLFGRFHRINGTFRDLVTSGQLPDLSIAAVRDADIGCWLKHVAFLGCEPPALEGLEPMSQFSGHQAAQAFEFAMGGESAEFDDCEAEINLAGCVLGMLEVFARMRDQLIADKGVDEAEKVIGSWNLDWMRQQATSAQERFQQERRAYFDKKYASDEPGAANFSKHHGQEGQTVITQEQLAAEKQRADAAQAELAEFKRAQTNAAVTAAVAGWVSQGKVLPHQKTGMAEFCMALHAQPQEFSFSRADGQGEEKKTPAVFFSEFMASVKPQVELRQRLPKDGGKGQIDPNDATAIREAAQEYQMEQREKGKEVSISVAVQHITDSLTPPSA